MVLFRWGGGVVGGVALLTDVLFVKFTSIRTRSRRPLAGLTLGGATATDSRCQSGLKTDCTFSKITAGSSH